MFKHAREMWGAMPGFMKREKTRVTTSPRARVSLLVMLLAVGMGGLVAAAEQPPNIVLILGDDQAWTDYGFMGHDVVRTPNLDRLAARSLVFERGYVTSPLCRPSLASMITGRHPFVHGITGNDVDGKNRRAELDLLPRATFQRHPSFIRLLTENGYRAHQSGKWWEGSFQEGGFTDGMTHGDPERGGRHGDEGLKIGRESMQPILDFVAQAKADQTPFFVWYAPFLPHTPHNPPERLLQRYRADGRGEDVARYYAMCEWFDETCGTLLNGLDEQGLTDNTVVIFICDNGWAAPSTNGDDPHQQAWKDFALRSKGSPFENGIRTPIMVSWPGSVQPARSEDLAQSIDLFPTIAAAAGLAAPQDLPGVNLLDPAARHRRQAVYGACHSIHNMTPGDPDATLQYRWCVDGDWKLILREHGEDTTRYREVHRWDTTPLRLYHITHDPHESQEVAADHPDIVARLRQQIEAWHPLGQPAG